MAHGIHRFGGECTFVQVRYGPFSRPIPEYEYRSKGYQPAADDLPWRSHDQSELAPAQLSSETEKSLA